VYCLTAPHGRFCSPMYIFMDPSHILNWNVQGLNSTARQDAVRVMVDASKINVVCLQETKMNMVSRRLVLSHVRK